LLGPDNEIDARFASAALSVYVGMAALLQPSRTTGSCTRSAGVWFAARAFVLRVGSQDLGNGLSLFVRNGACSFASPLTRHEMSEDKRLGFHRR